MLEAAVHLQDVDVVGEAVQQRSGQALRTEHLGPFVEGQVGGDQDGAPLAALAEDLEEEFADDQQDEVGHLTLEVQQPSLAPGLSGPLYLVFTGGCPSAVPQPAALAGNSPVYGPGWEFPLVVAQGVAGKPGLFLPGRTVYFCPFQPGVQQDDALRLRQGLGERAGGQESGPAGGAAGPRRLLPGKYPSRGSQRSQERPRRPPGTAGPGGRGGHPGGHPH